MRCEGSSEQRRSDAAESAPFWTTGTRTSTRQPNQSGHATGDGRVDYEGLRKFSDNLKLYFDGWQDMTEYDRNSLETRLLAEAAKLQLKAAKTDVLFKMLDSFNKNSIQVTVTWQLLDNSLGRRRLRRRQHRAEADREQPAVAVHDREALPDGAGSRWRTTRTSRKRCTWARSVGVSCGADVAIIVHEHGRGE